MGLRRTIGAPSFHGSRFITAIAIGLLMGCLFTISFPDILFSHCPSSSQQRRKLTIMSSTVKANSLPSHELNEQVSMLKSQLSSLEAKKSELENRLAHLTSRVEFSEQLKDQCNAQLEQQIARQKVGPFGTVKAVGTNPRVIDDDSVNPKLAKILERIAVGNELILVLANSVVKNTLEMWIQSIQRLGIRNYLIVALDDDVEKLCRTKGVHVYRRPPDESVDAIGRSDNNHAVSGLKFRILREFLQLSYSVLMSDVDIVYLQNPFDHLHRDSDVESMSDGHDSMTAYGYDDVVEDPVMTWSRYAHTIHIWAYNSGFFYIRPTIPAIELLDRVAARVESTGVWDQQAFNEELHLPSRPGYEGLYASRRTMDFYLFMNSKVLFRYLRHDKENFAQIRPVVVHINYHVDKEDRMKTVMEYYISGKKNALDAFPDGSVIEGLEP